MAWYGAESGFFVQTPLYCFLYWGIFVVLLAVSFYVVVLDVRYIRLLYALEKRELFLQTLGDEEFRKHLIGAQEEGITKNKRPD